MLNTPALHADRRATPAPQSPAPDQVAIRFESEAALGRALALARKEPWVAACRIEPATRTLHLRLCSGAAAPVTERLH